MILAESWHAGDGCLHWLDIGRMPSPEEVTSANGHCGPSTVDPAIGLVGDISDPRHVRAALPRSLSVWGYQQA